MKSAEEWAHENNCAHYEGEPCDVDDCPCHQDVLLIRAVQADAREAGIREAAEACDALTLLPDCKHSSQDYETGTHECALEINGRDCLCAQGAAVAEACKTRILALIPKEKRDA